MSDRARPGAPVLISAGGTGGHLFPARALAEELGRRHVPAELVTDRRGHAFDHGFPVREVHLVAAASPVGKSPIKVARAVYTLARGVAGALALVRRVRPGVVVGFGGYPTVPPVIAARLAGVPSVIHEQNAVMGRANRLLARFASAIATSVPRPVKAGARVLAHSVMTGNPVRDAVIRASRTMYSPPQPGGPFRLVVFGGSQGAHVFAELVPVALAMIDPDARLRIELVQQCRIEDIEDVRARYDEAGVDAELGPFFPDLPQRMAGAHLIIARSGASTVAEIAAIGRPAILVPLPHAIDDDQLHNARALEAAGGAIVIEQRALDGARLARDIGALMAAPDRLSAMAAAAGEAGRPWAVTALADLVLTLAAGGTAAEHRSGAQQRDAM